MRTRHSIIEDSFDISTAGTKTIDLIGTDPISRLSIIPRVTNPNAWVSVGHSVEPITKIELIDGSNVIISLTGQEAIALAYYSTRRVPVSSLNYMAREWAFTPIHIYFGRDLWDPEVGLDPKHFTNLQLKITHNKALAMTSAAAGTLTVAADLFDDNPPDFKGYLMSKQHHNLTLVADAVSYIDLPEDFPLRMIMSSCYSDSQAPEYQVSQLKLSEAHDKKIIFDEPMEELQQYFQSEFPPFSEKVSGMVSGTSVQSFWITPAFDQTISLTVSDDSDKVIQMDAGTGGQKRQIEGEGATTWEAIARGWAPHGSLPIDFRGQDFLDQYFNIGLANGARLKVTAAAGPDTTPTWNTITQQYKAY